MAQFSIFVSNMYIFVYACILHDHVSKIIRDPQFWNFCVETVMIYVQPPIFIVHTLTVEVPCYCIIGTPYIFISSFNPWEKIISRTYNQLRIFAFLTRTRFFVLISGWPSPSRDTVVTYYLSPYRSVTYHSDSFVFTRHFMWANVLRFLEFCAKNTRYACN